MSNVIGIDLGTTFSVIARLNENGTPMVESVDGERITASCVRVKDDENGTIVVGGSAKSDLPSFPGYVVQRFKRDMGTDKTYKLEDGSIRTPITASSMVLKKLVEGVETQTKATVQDVVITVPANFAERQRKATIEAGRVAGLNVTHLINEPTAAVLTFAQNHDVTGKTLIYDLGGGTFDVTIANVNGHDIECLTSEGDSDLGGIDFDRKLASLIDQKHLEEFGQTFWDALGLQSEEEAERDEDWQTLLQDCEVAKVKLSKSSDVTLSIPYSPSGRFKPVVTREEFEQACGTLIARTEMRVETALDNLDLDPEDVDHVLLVGGSSRMPMVKRSLTRIFNREPLESVNPDEAVALGAALYAGLKMDSGVLNAVQRESLSSFNVVDCANHYYGVIVAQDDVERMRRDLAVDILINKGERLPCSVEKEFGTVSDNQRTVNCRVTQSAEKETDPDFVNVILDEQLGPLPEGRPRGCPVKITYSYDLNQIMKVVFEDVQSGKKFEAELKPENVGSDVPDIPDFTIE